MRQGNQEIQEQLEIDENIKSLMLFIKVILYIFLLPFDLVIFIITIWMRTQKFSLFIKALFQEIMNIPKKAYNYMIDWLINTVAYELLYIIIEEVNNGNSEIIQKFKTLIRLLRINENNINNLRLIRGNRSNMIKDR